jgi:two-component system response regulator HydG
MTESKKRILIIDPDEQQRDQLSTYLKKEHYYVESGKGLQDAIKRLSEGCFNCLIMDVKLPEIKGYEAVPIIKNIDPNIKIIMTTNRNTKKLEAKVREQDIFFYFIKSFGKEELKLAINNAFHK